MKTVFIIGAGASKEANLPTGNELKKRIVKLLDIRFDIRKRISGDGRIYVALENLIKTSNGKNGDVNSFLHQAWHIRDALELAISIDNFIDNHRGNEKIATCGKLAIVRSILEAEKNSILFIDKNERNPGIKYGSLENTWYLPFFQLLTENCQVSDLEKRFKSIGLIIFNYDRCLEHYLYNALQIYYQIADSLAADLIGYLNIYHPYGTVGFLPWEGEDSGIDFGDEPDADQLIKLASSIKTFTEGTDPKSSNIAGIKAQMLEANRIAFLGFAFHKLNMEILTLNDKHARKDKPICFATTYGISNSDKKVVHIQINDLYGMQGAKIDARMTDVESNKFFPEFWRSLSF